MPLGTIGGPSITGSVTTIDRSTWNGSGMQTCKCSCCALFAAANVMHMRCCNAVVCAAAVLFSYLYLAEGCLIELKR